MDNARSVAARAWTWYRALWKKGRWGIAAGIVIPLLILGIAQATLQSVGVIDTPPTATPRPTATDEPTRTPEPPTATDAPATSAPTDEPATPVPVLPTEAPPAQIQPAAAIPAEPVDPAPGYDPAGDFNCKDFATGAQARAWWAYWSARGVHNPGGLDGNDDGVACQDD